MILGVVVSSNDNADGRTFASVRESAACARPKQSAVPANSPRQDPATVEKQQTAFESAKRRIKLTKCTVVLTDQILSVD